MKIDYYASSFDALRELGRRINRYRLNMNVSRKELSEMTNISERTIANIESGKDFSVSNLVILMRAFSLIDRIDNLLPPTDTIRPSDIVLNKKPRKRARKKYNK